MKPFGTLYLNISTASATQWVFRLKIQKNTFFLFRLLVICETAPSININILHFDELKIFIVIRYKLYEKHVHC